MNIEGIPLSWLPFITLIGSRPSLAPGEWPLSLYAGRLLTIGERVPLEQIHHTPFLKLEVDSE